MSNQGASARFKNSETPSGVDADERQALLAATRRLSTRPIAAVAVAMLLAAGCMAAWLLRSAAEPAVEQGVKQVAVSVRSSGDHQAGTVEVMLASSAHQPDADNPRGEMPPGTVTLSGPRSPGPADWLLGLIR